MLAALVIDMPEKCEDCPLALEVAEEYNTNICRGCEKYTVNSDSKRRPKQCPLKPMPISLIDFIKGFAERKNPRDKVFLEWNWLNEGSDEEYSFEGTPEEFVEKYTKDYDCLDSITLDEVNAIKIVNYGTRSWTRIDILIERE